MSKQAARNIQPPQPPQLPPQQGQPLDPAAVIAEFKGIIAGMAEEIAVLRVENKRLRGDKNNG